MSSMTPNSVSPTDYSCEESGTVEQDDGEEEKSAEVDDVKSDEGQEEKEHGEDSCDPVEADKRRSRS